MTFSRGHAEQSLQDWPPRLFLGPGHFSNSVAGADSDEIEQGTVEQSETLM